MVWIAWLLTRRFFEIRGCSHMWFLFKVASYLTKSFQAFIEVKLLIVRIGICGFTIIHWIFLELARFNRVNSPVNLGGIIWKRWKMRQASLPHKLSLFFCLNIVLALPTFMFLTEEMFVLFGNAFTCFGWVIFTLFVGFQEVFKPFLTFQ